MSFPSTFTGDVIRPGDEGYAEANKRWSKLSERNAKLVVFPKGVKDVVTAVRWAVVSSTELVVKSGSALFTLIEVSLRMDQVVDTTWPAPRPRIKAW